MTDTISTVLVGVTAHLVIDGTRYTLSGFEVTYVAGAISYADAHLAVGVNTGKTGGFGAGALPHVRGVPAKIIFTVDEDVVDPVSSTLLLRAGTHTAFDGLYDEAGPGNLSKGSFNIKVSLTSSLARLNTGTLQLGKLIPKSYLDTTVALSVYSNDRADIAPAGEGFTFDELNADFWHALRDILLKIAVGGALNTNTPDALLEFTNFFGGALNETAAKSLSEIVGTLKFGPLNNQDIVTCLADYLNGLFTSDFRYESFLSRINNLAIEFKYCLIESFKKKSIVPYSPFFRSEDAVPIFPSTWDATEWRNREPNSVEGVALLLTGPSVINTSQSGQPLLIGKFKRPSEFPLGAVLSLPTPAWMARRVNIDGSDGWSNVADDEVTKQIGNGYAKEMTYELAYRGRGLQVSCPLRTDIGLCTPVKLLYPPLPGTAALPAVYGSVQMVKLMMDTVQKQAGTTMEIGYVRSEALQKKEFEDYTHPIWTTQYKGGRLDD